MRLFASSTMSWKWRSSSVTVGSGMVRPVRKKGLLSRDAIEREHERAAVVRGLDLVLDLDVEALGGGALRARNDLEDANAGLPHGQRLGHVVAGEADGGRVVRCEDERVDLTAELRPHHPFAPGRQQDDPDRFGDVALAR